jgi:NADH-quinone oxidoreductase subunit N
MKYFVTGSFSSAFLLYGVALLYGLTASTSISRIGATLTGQPEGQRMALLAIGLLIVGFGFKAASVPFHMWTADVYEGAPTTVTAFMAAGVKAAAFGALLRVFGQGLPSFAEQWQPAMAVLAALTMIVGNLGALAQSNVKRMLAYSSIAHAGYLLTAAVAAPRVAAAAILFYLVGYAAVNLGGFGILAALSREGREPLSFSDMAGLASRRPVLAATLTVFLISLTGIPISAGFVGQVLSLLGGRERGLRQPRDPRRPDERGVGLLLPAHRRGDVYGAAGRRGQLGGDRSAVPAGAGGLGGRGSRSRCVARPGPRPRSSGCRVVVVAEPPLPGWKEYSRFP